METSIPFNSPGMLESMKFYNQAKLTQKQGLYSKAALFYQAAIKSCPMNGIPHLDFISMLVGLAEWANAAKAIQLVPQALYDSAPRIRFMHGVVLTETGKLEDAVRVQSALLGVEGVGQAALNNNLGACYARLERYELAEQCLLRSIDLGYEAVEVFLNLARVYHGAARYDLAKKYYQRGKKRFPDNSDLNYEYGTCLLKSGEFEAGFRLYRHRWGAAIFGMKKPEFPIPAWVSGSKVNTLLVAYEQGIGDQVVFSSMLPYFLPLAGKLKVYSDKRLHPLLSRSFPAIECEDAVASHHLDDISACDAYIMAGDMGIYAHSLIGSRRAFLQADAERVAVLREKYRSLFPGKRIIGISWRSRREVYGQEKTVSIEEWEPIFQLPDVQFVNYQYGDVEEDIARAKTLYGIDIYCDPDVDTFNDLDGVAAQALAFDKVITTSNSNAHLAGAVGADVWLIAPYGAGLMLYWGGVDESTYWYPSVRAFRVNRPREWRPVMERIAGLLT